MRTDILRMPHSRPNSKPRKVMPARQELIKRKQCQALQFLQTDRALETPKEWMHHVGVFLPARVLICWIGAGPVVFGHFGRECDNGEDEPRKGVRCEVFAGFEAPEERGSVDDEGEEVGGSEEVFDEGAHLLHRREVRFRGVGDSFEEFGISFLCSLGGCIGE